MGGAWRGWAGLEGGGAGGARLFSHWPEASGEGSGGGEKMGKGELSGLGGAAIGPACGGGADSKRRRKRKRKGVFMMAAAGLRGGDRWPGASSRWRRGAAGGGAGRRAGNAGC